MRSAVVARYAGTFRTIPGHVGEADHRGVGRLDAQLALEPFDRHSKVLPSKSSSLGVQRDSRHPESSLGITVLAARATRLPIIVLGNVIKVVATLRYLTCW